MSYQHDKPASFHSSPHEAMQSPPEEFVYLACLHVGTGVEKPDFLAVGDAEEGRSKLVCLTACMLPMVLIALWLVATPTAVYGHYVVGRGPEALGDQRLAATIMAAGGLPACALPALARARLPHRRRRATHPHAAA